MNTATATTDYLAGPGWPSLQEVAAKTTYEVYVKNESGRWARLKNASIGYVGMPEFDSLPEAVTYYQQHAEHRKSQGKPALEYAITQVTRAVIEDC